MMRERHAVVSFSYLLYSGDKSISPINIYYISILLKLQGFISCFCHLC